MRLILTLFLLGGLGAGGWFGYQLFILEPPEYRYRTKPVERGKLSRVVSATGTIEPLLKVVVGSQVSGTIMRYYADFNDPVKQGDLLAELDQDRFGAIVEQRKAAVSVARARVAEGESRLSIARLERERIDRAFRSSAASSFELETRRAEETAAAAAVEAVTAQLEAAEADLAQAMVDLDRTFIRAPIDGVVINRQVDEGQTVAASLQTPDLFTIANDLTKMQVNAAVSETDIGRVREGMTATFRVDAYPRKIFEGIVSQVRYAETIENNVVTYTTLIDVENPELLLRPGMTATVSFEVERIEDALIVPNLALIFDPQAERERVGNAQAGMGRAPQPRVYVKVDDESPLREVTVELGLNNGQQTAVTATELEPGMEVVVGRDMLDPDTARRTF